MAPSGNGSSDSATKLRRPAPQSRWRCRKSERARVSSRMGWPSDHSAMWSMKSRRPWSAQWMSSKTSTVVPCALTRSKNVRHAANSSSRSSVRTSSRPSRPSSFGSIQRRSASSGTYASSAAAILARVVTGSSLSASPARLRTISPRAQKVMPSPYAGERPWCQKTSFTRPSMYLRNSHASRLLPVPA